MTTNTGHEVSLYETGTTPLHELPALRPLGAVLGEHATDHYSAGFLVPLIHAAHALGWRHDLHGQAVWVEVGGFQHHEWRGRVYIHDPRAGAWRWIKEAPHRDRAKLVARGGFTIELSHDHGDAERDRLGRLAKVASALIEEHGGHLVALHDHKGVLSCLWLFGACTDRGRQRVATAWSDVGEHLVEHFERDIPHWSPDPAWVDEGPFEEPSRRVSLATTGPL
jgi:hypothetical protein